MVRDFIFDGRTLSSFGYMLVFENTEDTIETSTVELKTIKGARNDRSYVVGYEYADNYNGVYHVIKDPCQFPDSPYITDDEISEFTRWLCRKQYKWFSFIDEEDTADQIWYKAFFQVKKEYYGGCIGFELTITTSAPYGFSRVIEHNFQTNQFKIDANTDEEGYIYPDITIEILDSGTLRLTNVNENRVTELKNCVANEIITLSGYDIQQISTTNPNHKLITDFNYKFPRLVCEYNDQVNVFNISPTCKINLKYREIRKVGLK